jgi:hypothetical protein
LSDQADDRAREIWEEWDGGFADEMEAQDCLAEKGPAVERPLRVVVGGEPVAVTEHALTRYTERVSRFAERAPALAELMKLVVAFGSIEEPPSWYGRNTGGAGRFLLVGLNIAFPLRWRDGEWHAVTCASRGWVRETRRAMAPETARKPRRRRGRSREGRRA